MVTTTNNLQIPKPDGTDFVKRSGVPGSIWSMMDAIDANAIAIPTFNAHKTSQTDHTQFTGLTLNGTTTFSGLGLFNNGLEVASGTVAIGGAPSSNIGFNAGPSGVIIDAASTTAIAIQAGFTLRAQANNDNLYGLVINPTFNDNGKTGITHYGLYSQVGLNYFGGGLQVAAGNIGIGNVPNAWTGLGISASLTTGSGAGQGIAITPTITAQANSDVLYGLYINPTYADAGHTGVVHYGFYSQAGFNYFAGATAIGVVPILQAAFYVGAAVSAVGGAGYGALLSAGLTASANNDNLYGLNVSPAFNDAGHTGVAHWGIYSAIGNNFFGGPIVINQTYNGSANMLQVTGASANYAAVIKNAGGASNSFGVNIQAGTNTNDQAFSVQSSAGVTYFQIDGAGRTFIGLNGNALGFYGTTPTGRVTISGSRGGVTALTALMTALAGYGLIVDNTTP